MTTPIPLPDTADTMSDETYEALLEELRQTEAVAREGDKQVRVSRCLFTHVLLL